MAITKNGLSRDHTHTYVIQIKRKAIWNKRKLTHHFYFVVFSCNQHIRAVIAAFQRQTFTENKWKWLRRTVSCMNILWTIKQSRKLSENPLFVNCESRFTKHFNWRFPTKRRDTERIVRAKKKRCKRRIQLAEQPGFRQIICRRWRRVMWKRNQPKPKRFRFVKRTKKMVSFDGEK